MAAAPVFWGRGKLAACLLGYAQKNVFMARMMQHFKFSMRGWQQRAFLKDLPFLGGTSPPPALFWASRFSPSSLPYGVGGRRRAGTGVLEVEWSRVGAWVDLGRGTWGVRVGEEVDLEV